MIRLYESDSTTFNNEYGGICNLPDAVVCTVNQNTDGTLELVMEYPVNGKFFSEIKEDRIIVVKPNDYSDPQGFRIYEITKTLEYNVTINAVHVTYDMNDYLVLPLEINIKDTSAAEKVSTILETIFSQTYDETKQKYLYDNIVYNESNFNFIFDESLSELEYEPEIYEISTPTNLRELIFGNSSGLISIIKDIAVIVDNFNVTFKKEVNQDRGFLVKYSHNMTGMEAIINSTESYNNVYAYFGKTASNKKETVYKSWGEAHINDHVPANREDLPAEEQQYYIEGASDWPPAPYSKDWFLDKNSSTSRTASFKDIKEQHGTVGGTAFLITAPDQIYDPDTGTMVDNEYKNRVFRYVKTGWLPRTYGWVEVPNTDPYAEENNKYVLKLTTSSSNQKYEVVDLKGYEFPEGESDPNLDTTTGVYNVKAGKRNKLKTVELNDMLAEGEEITQELLYTKLKKYLEDNDVTKIKMELTVDFVKLSDFKEFNYLQYLEHIELYDLVQILHEDLGINVINKVVAYEYDCILGRYNSITIGEEPESMTDTVMTKGSNISDLTNNMSFATEDFSLKTVGKKIIGFTKEQISSLKGSSKSSSSSSNEETVNSGSLELNSSGNGSSLLRDTPAVEEDEESEDYEYTGASVLLSILQDPDVMGSLDVLVADLLIAENAVVKDTLTAGNIKVKGCIEADSGYIAGFHIVNTETDPTKPPKPVLTTNIEKTSVNDLKTGLYLNDDGISFIVDHEQFGYKYTKISSDGIVTNQISMNPFQECYKETSHDIYPVEKKIPYYSTYPVISAYSVMDNDEDDQSQYDKENHILYTNLSPETDYCTLVQYMSSYSNRTYVDMEIPANSYITIIVRAPDLNTPSYHDLIYDVGDSSTFELYGAIVTKRVFRNTPEAEKYDTGNLTVEYSSWKDSEDYNDKPKWTIKIYNGNSYACDWCLELIWKYMAY